MPADVKTDVKQEMKKLIVVSFHKSTLSKLVIGLYSSFNLVWDLYCSLRPCRGRGWVRRFLRNNQSLSTKVVSR